MGRKRRKFSAALKARVALEAIKGQRSVAEKDVLWQYGNLVLILCQRRRLMSFVRPV